MIVYGDLEREVSPGSVLIEATDAFRSASNAVGIERHGLLCTALIEAASLAQGLADTASAARGGRDGPPGRAEAAALAFATALARGLVASWRSGFGLWVLDGPTVLRMGDAVAASLLEDGAAERLRLRLPEGFAHYALYPEAYAEAALAMPPAASLLVVGIRSIGVALGAMVAGALPDARLMTLRPVGHPFARTIEAEPALAEAASKGREGRIALVDEGPGLSGSSVAAAIAWLTRTSRAPIHILPGHAGEPGPMASPETRALWAGRPRHVVPFETLILSSKDPAHRLETWFADLVGPVRRPVRDLSGGAWRGARPDLADAPADPPRERRKVLIETRTGPVLLRFAGLGRIGRTKFDLARRLHAAGFVPEPLGFRHGFLAERWMEGARAPDPVRERAAILDRMAAYLAFRAKGLPPPAYRGAGLHDLYAMVRHNVGAALGEDRAAALRVFEPRLARLEALRRPIAIDGKLQPFEWLVCDGRILKADALDHHLGHDLVGPQDIAWDVAGAGVEWGLGESDLLAFAGRIERAAGLSLDPELLAFCRLAYAGFRLGAVTMALDEASPSDRPALSALADGYKRVFDLGRSSD